MRITCPCRRSTSGAYSASGSQMMMSSCVTKKALEISRLALKDLPLPGVPRIRPLGFFKSFRSTIIKLLLRALMP